MTPDTANVTLDPEREIALLAFAETLPAGSAAIDLTYTGSLSTTLEGLVVSKDGADELLCTQCEVTGARAILPCFDEPIFKARFRRAPQAYLAGLEGAFLKPALPS